MSKILIVEDDQELCEQVVQWLTFEQHVVEAVHDGQEGFDRLKFYKYELAILDWNLPKISGVEICKRYRVAGGVIPILLLTANSLVSDKETGLDSGADDYLTKPFHMKELSARIRALLRRQFVPTGNILEIRNFKLDTLQKKLFFGDEEVKLSPKEFAMLEFLMRHPDELFSQEKLLETVWSSESDVTIFSVYTTVKTLRKKLSAHGEKPILNTVHGMGYRLDSK